MSAVDFPRALDLAAPQEVVAGPAARRGALLAALALGSLMAGLTAWAVWQSPALAYPHSTAPLRGLIVLAMAAGGTFTWWRRPTSPLGPLIIGLGGIYALGALNAFAAPGVYLVGRLALAGFVVYFLYVALAFPYGRLQGSTERRVFTAIAVVMAGLWVALLLSTNPLPRGYVLTDCAGTCPHNPLDIVRSPGFSTVFDDAVRFVTAAALAGVAVFLVVRIREAGRLRRRGYVPVLCALLLVAVSFVTYAVWHPGAAGAYVLQATSAAAVLVIPLALVLGQLRAHVITTWSLRDLLAEPAISLERLRDLLRDALGDPTLMLILWQPRTQQYVSLAGEPTTLPEDGPTRAVRPVLHEGALLGALVLDPVVDDASGVAQALAAASLICHTRRELLDELDDSRRAIVAETQSRIKIERELHDGAVQRLLSLQMGIAGARAHAKSPELSAELERLEEQARHLGGDLRLLAHGIYPGTLLEHGLQAALVEATFTAAHRVRLSGEVGRLSTRVEHAAYFCILEAVQNALRHAGTWARIDITLRVTEQALRFSVTDNGVGFDPATAGHGIGLSSMRGRISSVGGMLEIESKPGWGAAVLGVIPL
jgi:signal transduction histidine kinase